MWQAHEFMRRIGTVLRVKDDERWVDLIRYLDEKERAEELQHTRLRR